MLNELQKILGENKNETSTKKAMTIYTTPLDETMKTKLHTLAGKGNSSVQPTLITIEVIKNALNEYKLENQIYTEITIQNCIELSLSFKRILKIANLDNLENLQKLKLDNNMIMKIENLDKLRQIKWLDLSFNNITKIEGLSCLENLTDLSLFNNQISDVEGLDNCRALNILSLGRNNIKNPKNVI